ncbi:MAG: di-trans,poly-cis-decaprenylcistransferase [Chloroflexi bacterium HGW-Chloroflexi-9]|nr:MAG: di-trans,poly-cis-decaprenylcistransferase [Chloroflexi bacterium HGW-Chloroflexi-9]
MLRNLVYRIYERQLEAEVRRSAIPHHIGVILDGNRRFARLTGLGSAAEGHRRGADNAERLVAWCDELRIPVVTLWALSTDNFQRPADELSAIFQIVEEKVAQFGEMQTRSTMPRRIRAVGRRDLLPAPTRAAIERVEAATAGNSEAELIVAIGYGGREEITDAVRQMIAQRLRQGDSLEGIVSALDPDEIAQYLYAPDVPDPDLIIRTSGELRLSGFMLWQSAYSEYYFCDVFWPEFRRIDFLRAIRSYAQRQRRRGR